MNFKLSSMGQMRSVSWPVIPPFLIELMSRKTTYDIRPFSMQASESDAEYIFRLLRESGISWLIDEKTPIVASQLQSIEAQKLRLIDDNAQYKSLDRRSIRYHRSDATEQSDSITSLIAQRRLQPTAIHVQRWQADYLSQEEGAGSVLSGHQHSSQQANESLSLEQAWNISPAWIRDLKGEDQATTSSNAQLEKLNTQLNQYQALQAKYFTAHSSVRDTQVGYWFQLVDHPEFDKNHDSGDKNLLILTKRFYNQNNIPKDIKEQFEKLLTLSQWKASKDSAQERQANELTLIRRSIPVVPEYDPLKHRPVAHVQRAKVVTDGEEIYVDEWGRIKVRFLFTRTDDHALYKLVIQSIPETRTYDLSGTRDILNFICLKLIYKDQFNQDTELKFQLNQLKVKELNMNEVMALVLSKTS